MSIKNVIFDVGNVLVYWTPIKVISAIFPEFKPQDFYHKLRPIWIDLNLGKLTEDEAINQYQANFSLSKERLLQLMLGFKTHQKPLKGSIELLKELKEIGINLFAITDNTKGIIEYHQKNSAFPQYFKDIVVSADLGILKPNRQIYQYLLAKYNLNPYESVFIDDHEPNVKGALAVGMRAFKFVNTETCRLELIELDIPIRPQ